MWSNRLHSALVDGDLGTVQYFIEKKGYSVDTFYQRSLLFTAANHGRMNIVQYLVEHGANVNINDGEVLNAANWCGYMSIVKYLVDHGVNVRAWDGFGSKATFTYLLQQDILYFWNARPHRSGERALIRQWLAIRSIVRRIPHKPFGDPSFHFYFIQFLFPTKAVRALTELATHVNK